MVQVADETTIHSQEKLKTLLFSISLHPQALLEYQTTVAKLKVRVFCDFHGHSRQKNVFMYGCSRLQSWWPGDREVLDSADFMVSHRSVFASVLNGLTSITGLL